MFKTTSITVMLTIFLSACGGGGTSSEQQIDEIVQSLENLPDTPPATTIEVNIPELTPAPVLVTPPPTI